MGYFIEGLNGDSDPRLDFYQSVKYNHLSPAMDAGYGIVDPFFIVLNPSKTLLISRQNQF